MDGLLPKSAMHDYQVYTVNHIIENPISAIILECGLGKTVSSLTAIEELMFDRFLIRKTLVICPLRIGLNVWKQECEKWEHLREIRCAIAIGDADTRIAALNSQADIYNYQSRKRGLAGYEKWHYVRF